MKAYRIKNFREHYENSESKKIKRPAWVAIPINFNSDGFIEISEHPDGPGIYAVWICIVGLAMIGRRPEHRTGILDRKSGQYPHDIRTISRKIGFKESLVKKAMKFLIDPIGWVEIIDFESKEPITENILVSSGQHPEGTEREGTEREGTEQEGSPAKKFPDDSPQYSVALYLASKIQQISPQAIIDNTQVQSWAKDVDLMSRMDKRTRTQMLDIIDWVFKDDFWKSQIRSMGSLRKKWQEGKIPKKDMPKKPIYGRQEVSNEFLAEQMKIKLS